MLMCRVSVIIGVYNETPEHLRQALDSVLNQTYTDFECIIVLDNPQNETLHGELLQYAKKDSRVRLLVNEKNMGLAMSLNRAISVAHGEYLARMDADDISLPERFSKQIKYLELHSEIDVLGTNKILIDQNGNTLGKASSLKMSARQSRAVLQLSNFICHPSVMMRKESIERVHGYRDFPTTQDADLWHRMSDAGMTIANLDEYLIKYRINYQSVSFKNGYKQALIGRYISALRKERKRTGRDSFSVENLTAYLRQAGVDDPQKADRYYQSRVALEKARIALRNCRFFDGMKYLFTALKHPLTRGLLIRTSKAYIVRSKIGGMLLR